MALTNWITTVRPWFMSRLEQGEYAKVIISNSHETVVPFIIDLSTAS